MSSWMLAAFAAPVAVIVFGVLSALAAWSILRFAPPWMHPLALRIKREPLVWGYILFFGTLAIVLFIGLHY